MRWVMKMFVGVLHLRFRLFGMKSLKDKRSIMKTLISRISKDYNVSIVETDELDSKSWASIGVAVVGNNKDHIDRVLDRIVDFVEYGMGLSIVDEEREVF